MEPIELNFKLSLTKEQILSFAKHLGYEEKILERGEQGALVVPWVEIDNPEKPKAYLRKKAKEYVKGFVGDWTDTLVGEKLEVEKTRAEDDIKKPIENSLELN